jgi:hypothetical protein
MVVISHLFLSSHAQSRWIGLAWVIVLVASLTGCGWKPADVFGKASTTTASVNIQSVSAGRDPVTQLPVVTVNYRVNFPYNLFAQYTTAPTITCTMSQNQLTTTRTFSSSPVNITSATQTDQLNIQVPEEGRAIGGAFSVVCSIASDHPLNTSNSASVDVPGPITVTGKAIDTSGDWKFIWTWDVTSVWFVGKVSGGPDSWSFTGSLKGGGNAIWTPKVDSAQAKCTLTGNPNAPDASGSAVGSMSCTATFPDGTWQGNTTGDLNLNSISNGMYTFEYTGPGSGTGSDGKQAHIDSFDLKSNAQ